MKISDIKAQMAERFIPGTSRYEDVAWLVAEVERLREELQRETGARIEALEREREGRKMLMAMVLEAGGHVDVHRSVLAMIGPDSSLVTYDDPCRDVLHCYMKPPKRG